MSDVIKIKKGLNIKLKGKAEKIFIRAEMAEKYAVKPTDFHGVTPKLKVAIGDKVQAGSPLFYDKAKPDVIFTSPVSGEITEVVRGERRVIQEIVITPDKEVDYKEFEISDPVKLSREEVIQHMLNAGLWPYLRQRPFSVIPNPQNTPKAIFISAFDTSPLAPDNDYLVKDKEKEFQAGINALKKLTSGKIHVNVDAHFPVSKVYTHTRGIQINKFLGPHPAGNVGVQIHKIDPINKGEEVWYLKPQDVVIIGKYFTKGVYDASKVIGLTGSEVSKPRYYKVINGASIKNMVDGNVSDNEIRYISGNVLTGDEIDANGYLGFYHSQLTVIPEGKYYEFLGWALPGFKKLSTSRTFWSWLTPGREYVADTNKKGGERAFVVSGQYEKVFPIDVFPVQLLKAVMVEDIDAMENLGIYEVDPEDFALCEFVCTSKINSQAIIRNGLDAILKDLG